MLRHRFNRSAEYPSFITTKPNPRIFLSAGEASGDHYGAQLISALKAALPAATFTGLGGLEMERAGQDRVVTAEEVAHMGITEIIRHIPSIYLNYRKLIRSIREQKPDVAVLVDFPDVNFRLAKELKRHNVPVVYFVSPQLWAWKKSRLRWVQERVTKMLVIFPFEQPFYTARGVDSTFVGHPLAELPLPTSTRHDFAIKYNLDETKPWIALLPGSRMKEIHANLPVMVKVAEGLPGCEFIVPVANTLRAVDVQHAIPNETPAEIRLTRDAREALYHATVSVVASGTATVQAALVGNPFAVVYKVSALTFAVAKKLVSYPPEIPAPVDEHGNLPIAMPNLIAGKRIVPEFLQENYTPENVIRTIRKWLDDPASAEKVRSDLRDLQQKMALKDQKNAIDRVKTAVLQLLS